MGKYFVILGIATIFVVLVLMFARGRQVLDTWAKENEYEILVSDFRFFNRGPYQWTLFGKQWVFHVTVRASDGSIKTGYVKCGSFFWSVLVNKAEAILT